MLVHSHGGLSEDVTACNIGSNFFPGPLIWMFRAAREVLTEYLA